MNSFRVTDEFRRNHINFKFGNREKNFNKVFVHIYHLNVHSESLIVALRIMSCRGAVISFKNVFHCACIRIIMGIVSLIAYSDNKGYGLLTYFLKLLLVYAEESIFAIDIFSGN